MEYTYILTDSVKSVNRWIRRSNHKGITNWGTQSFTAANLAWQLLLESELSENDPASVLEKDGKVLLDLSGASSVLLSLIMQKRREGASIVPFIPHASLCLKTAEEVMNNLNLLRANPFDSSVSDDKAVQLAELMGVYEQYLQEHDLDDTISLMKRVLQKMKSGKVNIDPYKGKIKTCYFSAPSVLEVDFVQTLNGGTVPDSFALNRPSKDVTWHFVECFGIVNEADYVARNIIEKKIPLGDVSVIANLDQYAPFLAESFVKRQLDYSFASAVKASGFHTVAILKKLILWMKNGCNYQDLRDIMLDPLFVIKVKQEDEGKPSWKEMQTTSLFIKGISYGIGWGKDRYQSVSRSVYDLKNDPDGSREKNEQRAFRTEEMPKLCQLAENIAQSQNPADNLRAFNAYVWEHTRARNTERKVIKRVLDDLERKLDAILLTMDSIEERLDFLYDEVDHLTISNQAASDQIEVIQLNGPICLERKHIFVLGLSDKEFQPETADSSVLNDELRKKLFGQNLCGNVTLAVNGIQDAEKVMTDTFDTAEDGSIITLVRSSADVLKDSSDVAASSFFSRLLDEKKGSLNPEKYYYEITLKDTQIPRIAQNPYGWNDQFDVQTGSTPEKEISLTFSKSSLDVLLSCPLQYHYERELHIDGEEYQTYNPNAWLNAAQKGTFIHKVLEEYCRNALMGLDPVPAVFDEHSEAYQKALQAAELETEELIAAPSDAVKKREIEEYTRIISEYLSELHQELSSPQDGIQWRILACEEDLEKLDDPIYSFEVNETHFHLSFSGTIDRIDEGTREDGSKVYRIVDYKSGMKKTVKEMQQGTKQHLIYDQYLQKKMNISGAETFSYVYLKQGEKAVFTREMLNRELLEMEEKNLIYAKYVEGQYQYPQEEKTCKYCNYKNICLFKLKEA